MINLSNHMQSLIDQDRDLREIPAVQSRPPAKPIAEYLYQEDDRNRADCKRLSEWWIHTQRDSGFFQSSLLDGQRHSSEIKIKDLTPSYLPTFSGIRPRGLKRKVNSNIHDFEPHGVLAPNSRYREQIIPTRSVKVKKTTTDEEADGREEPDQTAAKYAKECVVWKAVSDARG